MPPKKVLKEKKINSAFLTLEEYKLLKEMTPEGFKDLYQAIYYGKQKFKLKTNMEIIQESPYIFFDIKNEKEPIFILNKPLKVSLNDLEIISRERIYKSGGLKYYYKYKEKKYFQKEKYARHYNIWTRSNAPIYPYVTLKELKPRLKLHGLKRIVKTNNSMFRDILDPFKPTWEERKYKKEEIKMNKKELYDIIKKNPEKFFVNVEYRNLTVSGRYVTTRYDLGKRSDLGKSLSKFTKAELQDAYDKAKKNNFKQKTVIRATTRNYFQ